MDQPTPPPPSTGFLATRWSLVARAGGDDPDGRAALAWLCRAYWEPLRAHAARRGWRDAEDAVQDFWVKLIERGGLASADRGRGRFRSWLLACLDHHLADRADAAGALKRGGGKAVGVLPADDAPGAVGRDEDPARAFDRAWAEALLARARARMAEGLTGAAARRQQRLERFLTANGDGDAYAVAARELQMSEGAVKVAVHRLRERFRESLRAEVAETLAEPTPQAIDAELDELLRALRP